MAVGTVFIGSPSAVAVIRLGELFVAGNILVAIVAVNASGVANGNAGCGDLCHLSGVGVGTGAGSGGVVGGAGTVKHIELRQEHGIADRSIISICCESRVVSVVEEAAKVDDAVLDRRIRSSAINRNGPGGYAGAPYKLLYCSGTQKLTFGVCQGPCACAAAQSQDNGIIRLRDGGVIRSKGCFNVCHVRT